MYFAFRWVLLHFKREFAPDEVMKLFEVLWTDLPCPNFHLLICLAILDGEREAILQEMNDLTTILKVGCTPGKVFEGMWKGILCD